jgi:hypothetical protein
LDEETQDKLRRIRGALDSGEKAMILECAVALEVSGKKNIQEVIDFILTERGDNPKLVIKAITSHCTC